MQSPLTTHELLPRGRLTRLGAAMLLFPEIESTNIYLLRQAAQLPDGAVACAEYQTAGRGRLGRRWEAPRGAAILLSVLLKEPAESRLLHQATLLAAVAACEAVEQITRARPTIRWPNDLLLSDRKFGGVLVESTPLSDRDAPPGARRAVVIGIGLNCWQQPGHFTGELAQTATSLDIACAHPVDRTAVARALLEHLDAWVAPTAQKPVAAAWRARCADIGSRIRLRENRRAHAGTVIDINDDGDLLVQLDEESRRYFPAATTTRILTPPASPGSAGASPVS